MKAVAKFEKVSRKQFDEAFDGLSVMDYDEIKLPHRATTGSAGYDFYSPISVCSQHLSPQWSWF